MVHTPENVANKVNAASSSTTQYYDCHADNARQDSIENLNVRKTDMITIAAGVIDSLRQTTGSYNVIVCGELPYAYIADSIILVGYGAACSLTVMVGYVSNQTGTYTKIITAGTSVTSVTSAIRVGTSSFNNATLPAWEH